MQQHGQGFAFIITLTIFLLVMTLIRQKKITERFALLWTALSVGLLVASSIGFRYLFRFASFVGIPYAPSALFLIAIFGLSLLVIELFVWTSKLNERTKLLTQELALLVEKLERMEAARSDRQS